MTFDEALEQVYYIINYCDGNESDQWYELLDDLRQEYAPTIEMTKRQYDFIAADYERENIVDAVANLSSDNILRENFHVSFWEPLTQREVVSAWLHPETIKIVDE